jgi:hypothetical protein
VWDQRIKLALIMTDTKGLTHANLVPHLAATTPAKKTVNEKFRQQSKRVAAAIINTCDDAIVTTHFHLLLGPSPAHQLLAALGTTYGSKGAQYTLGLSKQLLETKCGDSAEGVEKYLLCMGLLYRELETKKFNLQGVAVSIILANLPPSFQLYVNDQFCAESQKSRLDLLRNPSIAPPSSF